MSEEAEFPVADGSAPEPEVDSAVLGEEIAHRDPRGGAVPDWADVS
ncbi:hypothetical protein [Streptomyces sp. NPDC059271]